MLTTSTHGDATALPDLMILHGLFGSARNWGAMARRLSDSRRVITPDLRNHGQSSWAAHHSYHDLSDDLAEVTEGAAPLDLLGHSMGGKAAMLFALRFPARVRRLLIADIAPVAYRHADSQRRLIAAMQALPLPQPSRAAANAALTAAVPDAATRAFLLQSLDLKAEPQAWRFNLATLAAEMDRITGWPEVTGQFDGPALFLSGARSSYVLPEHRAAIRALFPAARFAKLPEAGHWLHADSPEAFEATIRVWFS